MFNLFLDAAPEQADIEAKYMKDGLTYAYKDAAGNEYIYGFGLEY